jgi:methylaspartate mutase epsilon subunit
MALETLRALRDTLRMAIEFRGLTLSSHLDFVANLQSRFARLVAGPPVFRSHQLLALVDAGILKLPFDRGCQSGADLAR